MRKTISAATRAKPVASTSAVPRISQRRLRDLDMAADPMLRGEQQVSDRLRVDDEPSVRGMPIGGNLIPVRLQRLRQVILHALDAEVAAALVEPAPKRGVRLAELVDDFL